MYIKETNLDKMIYSKTKTTSTYNVKKILASLENKNNLDFKTRIKTVSIYLHQSKYEFQQKTRCRTNLI